MTGDGLAATVVIARNSPSYLRTVGEVLGAGRIAASLPGAEMIAGMPAVSVDQCITPESDSGWYRGIWQPREDSIPAQISFTSGTEGTPRAVVLTHANLASTTARIVAAMGLTQDLREYIGVPVTHSFGMGRIRAASAVGGASYIPPRGFDLLEFLRMLEREEVNAVSLVPTLVRVMMRLPEAVRRHGAKLRWMEVGSQPMSVEEKLQLSDMFPQARIVQHYGLTEASRTTFLEFARSDGATLSSVGQPGVGVEVGLSSANHIRIRGPHVAPWYLDSMGLQPLTDKHGWLETSDLGALRGGSLHFEGRADDQINCGGIKLQSEHLGRRIEEKIRGLGSVTVARIPDAIRGDGILVVTTAGPLLLDQIKVAANAVLMECGVHATGSLQFWSRPDLPRTENGKVRRRQLAMDFAHQHNRQIHGQS